MTLWVPRAGSKLEGGVAHAFAFGLQCSDSSTRPPEPGTWTFQGRSAVPLPTTIGTTRQLAGRRDHRSAVGQGLDRLLATLRDKGYDGASLADLSAATGLAKSSLYHSFPGGKEEIALRVLEHLDAKLARALFEPLRSKRPPARKLAAMLATIEEHYDGGRVASLLGRLGASAERLAFRRALGQAFGVWLAAVEALCLEAGLPKAVARAEDLVVRLEGALVVASGTGDPAVFMRKLAALRRSVLAPPSAG